MSSLSGACTDTAPQGAKVAVTISFYALSLSSMIPRFSRSEYQLSVTVV